MTAPPRPQKTPKWVATYNGSEQWHLGLHSTRSQATPKVAGWGAVRVWVAVEKERR